MAEEPETPDVDVDLADDSPSSRIYRYIMRSQSDADGARRPLASAAPVEPSEAR